MTEPRRPMPEPRRPSMPHPAWTLTAGLALFLALLVLLAWQVRAGKDPALSAQQPTAQVAATPRRVLVRRVIRKVIDDKVILIHPAPVAAQVASAPTSSAASGYTSAPSAPASATYSAPTYSAPAPAAAPAPAPAPAPVVTRTS